MAHFIHPFPPRGLAVTFSGVLSQADRQAFEDAARRRIAEAGAIDSLIVLKDFQGLGADIDPHNLDFYAAHADDVLRMAIVGDPRWETQAHIFTGSGVRQTVVRYFVTAQLGAARQWLEQAPT